MLIVDPFRVLWVNGVQYLFQLRLICGWYVKGDEAASHVVSCQKVASLFVGEEIECFLYLRFFFGGYIVLFRQLRTTLGCRFGSGRRGGLFALGRL